MSDPLIGPINWISGYTEINWVRHFSEVYPSAHSLKKLQYLFNCIMMDHQSSTKFPKLMSIVRSHWIELKPSITLKMIYSTKYSGTDMNLIEYTNADMNVIKSIIDLEGLHD